MGELLRVLNNFSYDLDNVLFQTFFIFMMVGVFRKILYLDIKYPASSFRITFISSSICSFLFVYFREYLDYKSSGSFNFLGCFDRSIVLVIVVSFGYEVFKSIYSGFVFRYLKIKFKGNDILDVDEVCDGDETGIRTEK